MKLTWIKLIILSFLCFWISGCGDDTGGIYTTEVTFSDAGEDDTLGFDLYQDVCTPATATTLAKFEEFTDVLANITLSIEKGMAGITINGYSIQYIGQASVNAFGNLTQPPALAPLNGHYNIHVDTNSSTTFSIDLFSTTQKQEFIDLAGFDYTAVPADPNAYTARYSIRIVLHCTDDSGDDRDIEILRTVYFDNYWNC